ncbi:uncharacterized protein [Ptychodera flava]|uniref:uncharacterized protein n=1 Tax=Ptychodera flava TaxID=63121 RepID=UPI00396A9FD8
MYQQAKVCKFKAAGCNQQLTEHYDPGRGECSGKLVPCKYKSVGCDALLQEQHLDVHYRENISLHIDLTYNRTLDIQAAIRDVEGDLTAIDGPEKQKKPLKIKSGDSKAHFISCRKKCCSCMASSMVTQISQRTINYVN